MYLAVSLEMRKVAELVSEITAASREQSQGIEQVNTAVTEMDKVTQTNAANAEESAAASEELNAQAEQMKNFVLELMKLVGGKETNPGQAGGVNINRPEDRSPQHQKALGAPKPKCRKRKEAKEEKAPEEIIPFDDDNLSDF